MSSRLNFKESEVIAIDSSSSGDEQQPLTTTTASTAITSSTTTVYATKHKNESKNPAKSATITSYDLFDLTKDSEEDEQKTGSTSHTKPELERPEVTVISTASITHTAANTTTTVNTSNTPSAADSKKAEKRREKRKQLKERKKAQAANAGTGDNNDEKHSKPDLVELLKESSDEEAVKSSTSKSASAVVAEKPKVVLPVSVSSFLERFLKSKRAHIDDYPVEEIEVTKDTYLQLFSEDFKGDQALKLEEDEDTDDAIDDVFQTTTYTDLEDNTGLDSLPIDFEVFNIYNLPYKIQEQEVEAFVEKHGFTVKSVELGGEGNKKMPLGSASVKIILPEGITADQCAEKLQSKVCGGRQIRVQKAANDTKRRLSYGRELNNRYFESDISAKCMSCGEVGHRSNECTNDPLPVPCHLCGGIDHDPGSCPNLICYRCSSFGHHSRDCRNAGRPKPVICFHCGSLNHDSFNCHELNNRERPSRYESLVEGPWIKCMTCNKQGHLMCNKMPWERCERGKAQNEIYCPNCGEQGHHVDYTPLINDRWARVKYCVAPKCEAFFKFPQLKDVDDLLSENRDDLYRKMARGPNDINLFPSLTNPYSQDYDNDRGGRDRGFGNNKRRQSEGNRYYDNGLDDDYDDSRYNQNSNSRRVVRYSEGDDRSRRNHQHDNRNYDPRRESNGSYSNDRNNSYANNKRKRFDDDGGELEVFERRDYKRNNTNNQQQYAQQPARSNFNSNQNPQSSKEWQDRIESRKKRFSE